MTDEQRRIANKMMNDQGKTTADTALYLEMTELELIETMAEPKKEPKRAGLEAFFVKKDWQ